MDPDLCFNKSSIMASSSVSAWEVSLRAADSPWWGRSSLWRGPGPAWPSSLGTFPSVYSKIYGSSSHLEPGWNNNYRFFYFKVPLQTHSGVHKNTHKNIHKNAMTDILCTIAVSARLRERKTECHRENNLKWRSITQTMMFIFLNITKLQP